MFCKRTIFCVRYMQIHILMSLIIVTVKVQTVIVMSSLVHVNNRDLLSELLLVTVKQVQWTKKVVNRRTLMIKQVMGGVKRIKKTKEQAFPWNHRSQYSN